MSNDYLIGKVINERYELLDVVGSGGMATVYKAQDRLLNRFVAVKILKESLKYDNEIVDKFGTEAKAAASLSHNNIVSVYDVGTIDGLSYIVMEFIDGETLKEYINRNKPIKWQTACEITIQIANALSAAHEKGIIHRDIKPHNILITKDGTAKVADFGIARAVSSDTVVAGGSALGSVHYISPEQARGGFVDNSSDLYSLGVVLYEMLTGSLPFDGDNAVSIALKKLEEEPLSPKVINLDIPQTLDTIVMKSISKEQHMRYKNAEDFAADLKALLNEDSMHIISPRRAEDDDEPERRGRGKNNKKKASGFNPIIASCVLVVIIAVVTFFVMNSGRKEYIVPDLLGRTLEEALTMVNGTEFTIDEEGIVYEVSEEVEEGKIINQNPGANQSVKKNKKIQLTISSGATEGNIPVPNVLGSDYSDAKAQLEAKGLKCQMIEEESSEYELNKVISQSPKYGTKVTEGYTVILHVCTKVIESEEKNVEVPNLKGMTRADAEKALTAKGLIIGNTKKQLSDIAPGQVISQEPEEGTSVAKGSAVSIVISEQSQAGSTSAPVYSQTPSTPPPENSAQTPQPEAPDTGNNTEVKRKTLTINIPDSAGDTVHVRVIANGKEIHNGSHAKSEGKIDIPVESSSDAEVEVYMDGELVVRKIIQFN